MVMRQFSIPSGWQNGISSWVRFAPMTPAMMAVSNTGPFGERKPPSRSAAATAGGKRTWASAVAVLCVAALPPMSTMAGCRLASTWVRVICSTADVVHFDLLSLGRRAAEFFAQFAVAIGAVAPDAADQFQHLGVAGARAQRRPQVETVGREQAGIELTLRGQARAAAGAAKGLRHRGDESHFAAAVVKAPSLRHLAMIVLRHRLHRPALVNTRGELARRDHQFGAPLIAIAHVHEFDESHDDRRAAKAFDQVEHGVFVQAAFDD